MLARNLDGWIWRRRDVMADGTSATSWCRAAVDEADAGRLDGGDWWDAELADRVGTA